MKDASFMSLSSISPYSLLPDPAELIEAFSIEMSAYDHCVQNNCYVLVLCPE